MPRTRSDKLWLCPHCQESPPQGEYRFRFGPVPWLGEQMYYATCPECGKESQIVMGELRIPVEVGE